MIIETCEMLTRLMEKIGKVDTDTIFPTFPQLQKVDKNGVA